MRGKAPLVAAAVLVLVILGAAYVVLFAPDPSPRAGGLAPAGPTFTDTKGLIQAGPYDAAFSPNGARLAVLSSSGLYLSDEGKLEPIIETGGQAASGIVDFAWFPGSKRILVAEGPSPTSRLNVIDLEGEVVAAATLSQPVTFAEGYGLTVDSTNTRAVAVHVTRDAVGGLRHLDLAVIDLTSGKVEIRETPDLDERDPTFVDDGSVLVTIDEGGEPGAFVLDLATGNRTPVGSGARVAAGVLTDSETPVVQTLAERPEVRAGDHVLGTLSEGANLVALHPTGTAGVERAPVGGDGETRLRVVSLDPPRR